MGAPPKGLSHGHRSMTAYVQMARPLATSMLRSGGENLVVHLAVATLPQYAPLIYGGYVVFRYGRTVYQTYREYQELRKRICTERSLRIEGKRTAFRETTDMMTQGSDADFERYVSRKMAILLARPAVASMIDHALGDSVSEATKERFRMMIQETGSSFLVGAVLGGKGKMIDEAAKLFLK